MAVFQLSRLTWIPPFATPLIRPLHFTDEEVVSLVVFL